MELGKARPPVHAPAADTCRNGAQLLELGKEDSPFVDQPREEHAAMEPSFWSWEKQAPTTSPTCISGLPQWSPAFGAGKSRNHRQPHLVHPAAMEPSFWSWEKWSRHTSTATDQPCRNGAQLLELGKASPSVVPSASPIRPQWSPAFGAGKSRNHRQPHLVHPAAMEPSFWSWEKDQLDVTDLGRGRAAMEPSFWSWEKPSKSKPTSSRILGRNGAQLLELGKGPSPKRW